MGFKELESVKIVFNFLGFQFCSSTIRQKVKEKGVSFVSQTG